MRKLVVAITLLSFTAPAFAFGVTIATALLAGTAYASFIGVTAFAINMIVATIVTKAFFTPSQPDSSGFGSGSSPNPGNRQQIPPATDNKLPVVYGSAYVGGTITDLSISEDNQQLYYVLSICEVTSTNDGQTPDEITFGDVYFGGKKVIFESSTSPNVTGLLDESTGITDTTVNGRIQIFLYKNGSNNPVRGTQSAIQVMQTAGLTYTWDSNKLMSNCAFAILHLSYSQSANIRGIEQTKFQVTNSRTSTGECFKDYLINTRYGCSILESQIDTVSLDALTTYSNQNFTYVNTNGATVVQPRFKFNGVLDTKRTVMQNLQDMASCCDCLLRYTEITGKWGVIVQSPTYTVAMNINDSNMISAIQITPLDIAASYNVVECKFPDESNQDAFNSTTFDLAEIDPSLLYPNEPINKASLSLPLTNNSVTAQYLAIRLLKSGREDLQVQVSINFVGIQLNAGDIVTVTNTNYGWAAKLFRINKIIQAFNDDGSIAVQLNMSEFNPSVYDDYPITQFNPAPNTGIGDPTFFGIPPAPVIIGEYETNTNPFFVVKVTTAPAGITQYAEIWYSAYNNPLQEQMYFAGTSEIQSNGTPWSVNTALPNITLSNIPAGNWYLFSRMVNSLASSAYSSASSILYWRPSTFQYTNRYLTVAYGTSITGAGFSLNPRNKTYYGLDNTDSISPSTNPADYTWYLADPNFGTNKYLAYCNRTGRKFSFDTDFATLAGGNGAFVPASLTADLDPSIWSALPDGTNYIDLDARTGQLLETGGTTTGYNTGEIAITNNPDGRVIASLSPFLATRFGTGVYQKTSSAATITVDVYGRVVGFEAPDDFYYTDVDFTATAGQTVFSVTRGTGYILGQCWVLRNGVKLEPSYYTDATSTVTLTFGANAGDIISIISFKAYSNVNVTTISASGTGTIATLVFATRTFPPFTVGQSITVSGMTPTGYNGTYTVTACDESSVSYSNTTTGASSSGGSIVPANPWYAPFTINTANLINQSSYTASGFTLDSGYELLFLNGTIMTDQDYDIIGQTITNFPAITSGTLTVLQWNPNNLGQPTGSCVNSVSNTIIGQATYPFSYDANAFNLYANGVMYKQGADYTTGSGGYTLTVTPNTVTTVLVNQTFVRTGAV